MYMITRLHDRVQLSLYFNMAYFDKYCVAIKYRLIIMYLFYLERKSTFNYITGITLFTIVGNMTGKEVLAVYLPDDSNNLTS